MAARKRPSEPTLQTVLERIDRQTVAIDDLRASMDAGFNRVDARFARMDERQDVSESRLDGMGSRLDGMGSRLDGMDSRLDAMDSRLSGMDSRLDAFGSRQDDMASRLEALDVKVDSQGLLLAEMRSQNRLTIEAVEAVRVGLERRIDQLDQESRARDSVLELAIRDLKVSVQQMGADMRDLAQKVDALIRLEARVSALERRLG
jgi:chromosome segregation ATPase